MQLHLGALREHAIVCGAIRSGRHPYEGRPVFPIVIGRVLGEIPEERRELKEFLLRQRIELVVVTVRAAHGEPEKGGTVGLRSLALVVDSQLLADRAAFSGADPGTDETRRDDLVRAARGQQVPRQLLTHEPVERLVVVERLDDVVAIRPDAAEVVDVNAVGVAVSRDIQPVARPVLAITGTGQQAID